MSTFAYADPPYIGQAKRLYGKHADYAGEVDHAELIQRLCDEYDGWALSLSMKSLPQVMKSCPDDVRTLAWIKPGGGPPMGDHFQYTWEPVIIRSIRRPVCGYVATHLILNQPQYTFREKPKGHVVGQKPEGFCHWIFEACGLEPSDDFTDLYPGSGAVGRAWDSFGAGRLLFEVPGA